MSVLQNVFPDKVSVSFYHRVSAHLQRFFRKNRAVNTADDNRRAALLCFAHYPITRPAVSRVDPNSDDVSRVYAARVKLNYRFIDDDGIAGKLSGGGAGDDVEPTGSNHAVANGGIRRVDQYHAAHNACSFSVVRMIHHWFDAAWKPALE